MFSKLALISLPLFLFAATHLSAEETQAEKRDKAQKTIKAGNVKDAYALFSELALDPKDDAAVVSEDLKNAITCLQRNNREDEIDDFREKVIAAHSNNWRLQRTAAQTYITGQHVGYIVAGKFSRGHRRGEGKYVSVAARDRVRGMQLFRDALAKSKDETDKNALSLLYSEMANALMPNGFAEAWRLQDLTDIEKLPDYEDGYYGYRRGYGYGGGSRGAPVNPDGTPVYYKTPKSYEAASSDGERWRFCLMQAEELNPTRGAELRLTFAQFLQNQFDVRTMAGYGYGGRRGEGYDKEEDESGPFAVKSLAEDETIAKLASGVKRFKLPDEFNFIKIYQTIVDQYKGNSFAGSALTNLAALFEDRQQYDRAVEYWKRAIAEKGDKAQYQNRIEQILGNWGQFEGSPTQPAGAGATVGYRFRNGTKVSFEATEVNIPKLLEDIKAYIKSKPRNVEWQKINVEQIGYRLVHENATQYLGAKAGTWDLDLKPREKHFDRMTTIETPLKKAGAYFVVAKMADGNTSRIILWVADTAIVKKALDKQTYLYVADAISGNPVPNAKLDFFGYQQQWNNNNVNINVGENAMTADGQGQVFINDNQLDRNYSWIITATTPDGRFAHLGFTGMWANPWYDQDYNQVKAFGITDRPVYRPDQTVKFKFWAGYARYDQKGQSAFANQSIHIQIHNPKGETILQKDIKADEFGGIDGEFKLDKQATLGVYGISAPTHSGYVSFRLEEYKKPEFEVSVDAPSEPVALGEKINATIKAKYYFGAPVANAKVKYKVMRSSHSASFMPRGEWDWFYEPGYWWFAYDYPWYPGFREWGLHRPSPWWWDRQATPPELVSEDEVPLNSDGTFKIEIDSSVAKALHPDTDHRYEITAEVTDASRRTITGSGSVIAARKPFKVYAWVDRGYFQTGDAINAEFSAQTIDNKPVKGKGGLKLLAVSYDKDGKPTEKTVQEWPLDTNEEGKARQQMKAAQPGQYRLSYTVVDNAQHAIEGGYVFVIRGEAFNGAPFRFNDLELIPDKREYAPNDKVKLMINADRENTTVLLFPRAANGVCIKPQLIHLSGKSVVEELTVSLKDMPNFFVEAATVSGGKVFAETKEIVVPPESRVLNVSVLPNATEFKPGQKAKVKLQLTDTSGEPVKGSSTIAVYDKSVEYISGGSNVGEIKSYFWKWRRQHYPQNENSLTKYGQNLLAQNEKHMGFIGAFGALVAQQDEQTSGKPGAKGIGAGFGGGGRGEARKSAEMMDGAPMEKAAMAMAAPAAPMAANRAMDALAEGGEDKNANGLRRSNAKSPAPGNSEEKMADTSIRTNFADTAYWSATLNSDDKGIAEFEFDMPESLTTWKFKVWTMAAGTRVGQGEVEAITKKNVIIRMQSPRFFTQNDEVVLSANVHNFLKEKKKIQVLLEGSGAIIPGSSGPVPAPGAPWVRQTSVEVEPNGETRVDFLVKVAADGEATVRMKALTNEESDAMEMKFPAYIHGMLKTESFSGNIRPDKNSASVTFNVPAERKPDDSRVEVRYSPTLAGAMVDALPYLADYPYGCTEQTLNRFLPTVMTQKILLKLNVNLKDIQNKTTNLNAQEIGKDTERAKQWKRYDHNAVFDEPEVAKMVRAGVERLAAMQCGDGGWGWFSGAGEYSYPHTTAYVVHGLQLAKSAGVQLPSNMLERGVAWLKSHQDKETAMIRNAPTQTKPYKTSADNMDAFVYMVMADAQVANNEMRDYIYRDRNNLAVYAKAMFGLAMHKQNQVEQRDMLVQNIDQFLVQDNENQTAYLKLPENNYWWYWYGSEYEAQAYYLKLLSAVEPKGEKAPRLVKYLLNNRRHATYWNSTRDTAVVVEAMADYLTASGEDAPDMNLEVVLDGKVTKAVQINSQNLFTFDNKFVLEGKDVTTGAHTLEFRKKGTGPLYFNAYTTNFTLEDPITKAGLEIKVNRKYYKLKRVDKSIKVEAVRGQSASQKVEKYDREELPNLAQLKSGDLVEIELEIDSKNDYEYILFEDMKAAGFEPVEVRSGYNGNDMGAYVEFRDERVCLFVRALARGKHSVAYRVRAEIPGTFSALPTRASAMYAPELKANSDEIKMKIEDPTVKLVP